MATTSASLILLLSETYKLHTRCPPCVQQDLLEVLQLLIQVIRSQRQASRTLLIRRICLRYGGVDVVQNVHGVLVDVGKQRTIQEFNFESRLSNSSGQR
jgi:hypothetical protein